LLYLDIILYKYNVNIDTNKTTKKGAILLVICPFWNWKKINKYQSTSKICSILKIYVNNTK